MTPTKISVPICLYSYYLKWTKFGLLRLWKIIKIVSTRCQIIRLKCTKFDFGWVSAPDPAEEAYSSPPDPISDFMGVLLSEGKGKWRDHNGFQPPKSALSGNVAANVQLYRQRNRSSRCLHKASK